MELRARTDAPRARPAGAWRELATSLDGGLEVTLLWCKRGNRVKLFLTNLRTRRSYELEVDAADAVDAYLRPFAYATWIGPLLPPAAPPANPWDDAEEWDSARG
jgi:hypothetical protein